ncbi:MAG: amino acid ABC transporter permease [Desulfobacteraceae bacterium]
MGELLFLQQDVFSALMRGLWVSIKLIIPSGLLGLAIGILVGAARVYGNKFLMGAADLYVAVFRGFPLVVQLFIWYFGLPHVGVYLTPYLASVLGFTLCSSAYHSEYVRGAFLSIKRGQMLAAEALGFSRAAMVVFIMLPQAFRRALPGCGNELIYLIKYSSLAYMVTCIELTGEGKIIASETFRFTEVFTVVGLIYLGLTTFSSWGIRRLEQRLNLPGFERYRM